MFWHFFILVSLCVHIVISSIITVLVVFCYYRLLSVLRVVALCCCSYYLMFCILLVMSSLPWLFPFRMTLLWAAWVEDCSETMCGSFRNNISVSCAITLAMLLYHTCYVVVVGIHLIFCWLRWLLIQRKVSRTPGLVSCVV